MDLSGNMSASDMDDITYLLQLEAMKRFSEDTKNIHRIVEEKSRILLEAKQEYQFMFARLADICKQAYLSKALDASNMRVNDTHVSGMSNDLATITDKIATDQRTVELDSEILQKCKDQLETSHKPRQLLATHQLNYVENIETLKAVRSSLDTLENDFEATTLLAMNQLTDDIKPPVASP